MDPRALTNDSLKTPNSTQIVKEVWLVLLFLGENYSIYGIELFNLVARIVLAGRRKKCWNIGEKNNDLLNIE